MSQNLEIFSPKYLVTTCYHSELKITVNVFVSEIFVVNLDNKDFLSLKCYFWHKTVFFY